MFIIGTYICKIDSDYSVKNTRRNTAMPAFFALYSKPISSNLSRHHKP